VKVKGSRWRTFSLQGMAMLVTLCAVGLGLWKSIGERYVRRQSLIEGCQRERGWFTLADEFPVSLANGKSYHVLVFNPVVMVWPGHNPYKIVVANKDYRVVTSDLYGGEELLDSTRMVTENGRTIVEVTCLHRPMRGGIGTYRYEITPERIVPLGVRWDDEQYWDRFSAALERAAAEQ